MKPDQCPACKRGKEMDGFIFCGMCRSYLLVGETPERREYVVEEVYKLAKLFGRVKP